MNEDRTYSALARRVAGGLLVAAVAAATFIGVVPSAQAALGTPSQSQLFMEQVASQKMIGILNASSSTGMRVQYIALGRVTKRGSHREIGIRVHTKGGSDISGVLDLQKVGSKWFFYSVTRGSEAGGISKVARPAGIPTNVVMSAITQQSKHQSLIAGLVSGGYKKITVTGYKSNFGTRTVSVRLSGGSKKATTGKIVSIRKTDSNGKVFWFLTDFR